MLNNWVDVFTEGVIMCLLPICVVLSEGVNTWVSVCSEGVNTWVSVCSEGVNTCVSVIEGVRSVVGSAATEAGRGGTWADPGCCDPGR